MPISTRPSRPALPAVAPRVRNSAPTRSARCRASRTIMSPRSMSATKSICGASTGAPAKPPELSCLPPSRPARRCACHSSRRSPSSISPCSPPTPSLPSPGACWRRATKRWIYSHGATKPARCRNTSCIKRSPSRLPRVRKSPRCNRFRNAMKAHWPYCWAAHHARSWKAAWSAATRRRSRIWSSRPACPRICCCAARTCRKPNSA